MGYPVRVPAALLPIQLPDHVPKKQGGPRPLAPSIHEGDGEATAHSWLWPSPALAHVAMWEAKQADGLFLYLFLLCSTTLPFKEVFQISFTILNIHMET